MSGLWLQAAVRQPFWRKKEESGEKTGRSWSGFPELPVFTAEFEVLSKMTGYNLTRGMLCAMYRPAPKTIEEVAQGARRLAILENVVNPTNVGAIFRSAAGPQH